MAQTVKHSKKPMSWLTKTIITGICGALLLVVANSAMWVNNYIFNSENFARVVSSSLTSESSRGAIAQELTDSALKDYPVVKNVAGSSVTKVVSGVLATDRVEKATTKVVEKLHVRFTSNTQESVVIDLSGVKGFLEQVVSVVGEFRDVKFDPSQIPSEIVLIDKSEIPNFYKYSVVFLWLGPISFIGGVALLAYPYFKNKKQFRITLLTQGAIITLIGLMALLVGPLFKPPLLSNVSNANMRVVVGNLYNDMYQTFVNQTAYLIALGIVITLSGTGLILFARLKKK